MQGVRLHPLHAGAEFAELLDQRRRLPADCVVERDGDERPHPLHGHENTLGPAVGARRVSEGE